jgi:hypothetical protein
MDIVKATFAVVLVATAVVPMHATQIGTIWACYACQNTGNPIIDAALAANSGVAGDGILFAFMNTGSSAITGGVFSVSSNADSFSLPAIPAGGTFILMPGITTDGGTHPTNGLFFNTGGAQDTSDGAGGVSDASKFSFTGLYSALSVTSTTFGTSTGTPGTFTPGDPGLIHGYISPANGGQTSFIGDGPSGDGGCTNCWYGEVATLNVTPTTGTPEPASGALLWSGLGAVIWTARRSWAVKRV